MRTQILLVAAPLLAGCSLPFLHHSGSGADEIVKLERSWNTAVQKRDSGALDNLLSPDFTLGGTSRTRGVPKTIWLRNTLRSTMTIDSISSDSIEVAVTADTARASLRYRWKGEASGQTFRQTTRFDDVWIRENGRWRVRSRRPTRE